MQTSKLVILYRDPEVHTFQNDKGEEVRYRDCYGFEPEGFNSQFGVMPQKLSLAESALFHKPLAVYEVSITTGKNRKQVITQARYLEEWDVNGSAPVEFPKLKQA